MPISNIVLTTKTAHSLDLFQPRWLQLLTYQPPRRRFPGGTLRIKDGTFLLFTSGNVVINGCIGLPNLETCEQLLGIKLEEPRIRNVCGYLKLGAIKLSEMVLLIPGSEYEPELHPGLMFKQGTVSVIAYHTGTVMYCGCKSITHCMEVEESLTKIINNDNKDYSQNVSHSEHKQWRRES